MDTQQDNQIASLNGGNAEETLSVGKTLRAAREKMDLSVNDVANRIKFAPRQIESLEADDYDRLPEAAFVRGFVRSYARLLELDPARLLSVLPSTHVKTSSTQEVKSVEIPMPSELSGRRYNIMLLAVGLVIALSVAIFERVQNRAPEVSEPVVNSKVQAIDLPNVSAEGKSDEATEQAQAPAVEQLPAAHSVVAPAPLPAVAQTVIRPVTVPVVQPVVRATPAPVSQQQMPQATLNTTAAPQQTAKPAPVVAPKVVSVDHQPKPGTEITAAEHSLRMEFDEESWVEIKEGDGQVLTSRMHTAGSLVRITGKSPLIVTIGNARAVRLFDSGKKINLERYTTADVARITLK